MNFSLSTELIWDMAAREAVATDFPKIELEHFLLAILKFPTLTSAKIKKNKVHGGIKDHQEEMDLIKNLLKNKNIESYSLIIELEDMNGGKMYDGGKMGRSERSKEMFRFIEKKAVDGHRTKILVSDFLKYILEHPTSKLTSLFEQFALRNRQPNEKLHEQSSLANDSFSSLKLLFNVKNFQEDLSSKIFGQDQAIKAFTEAVSNIEIHSKINMERKAPQAILLFAGPPGVGKTYLAETGAVLLGRPYKRFDMSGFAEHHQHEALIGISESYSKSRKGMLTQYVYENPKAVLLFDEIEKAHINTVHLFLQILDSGNLEDKYTLDEVNFSNAIIIFTTNAGSKLYENSKISGLTSFHSKTVLNALENDMNPETGKPNFPPAICSRLSTGYVVLFNQLKINNLVKVVNSVLSNFAKGFYERYHTKIEYDPLLPYLLVLKEGVKPDARMVRSQAAKFITTEISKGLSLMSTEGFEQTIAGLRRIDLSVDQNIREFTTEKGGNRLFTPTEKPKILVITEPIHVENFKRTITEVDWISIDTREGWLNFIGEREIDMVLLDLWIEETKTHHSMTYVMFPIAPPTSRRFDFGRDLLGKINKELPETPVYLLSLDTEENVKRSGLEGELLKACIQGGGAEGFIVSKFTSSNQQDWQSRRDEFKNKLLLEWNKIYLEKIVRKLGQEQKVFSFESTPKHEAGDKTLNIRLRNPTLTRAMLASDVGEVLDEIERPRVTFKDVIGAEMAKRELQFFIEFLQNPRKYAADNLKPPKGILLHGPSGTGKTMLARAFAGESDVAFLPVNASSFITMWKGSGPQNIKELFDRARKYAPSVIFIDEIDAIGKMRSGSPTLQSEESTLNALLVEMDGFSSQVPGRPVFVLAATNFTVDVIADFSTTSSSSLDPALVRRFSKSLFIDLPDKETRSAYLKSRLLNRRGIEIREDDLENIAERTSGMSFADLESMIETADRDCAELNQQNVSIDNLNKSFEDRFGEQKIMDKSMLERTAFHEGGHTLLYYLTGHIPPYVTIVARGKYGGYMATAASENEAESFTKEQLLEKVRVALAGRAIEVIKYGEDGLTTGAANDLKYASSIVRKMICVFGMYEEYGLFTAPELLGNDALIGGIAFEKMNDLGNKILNEQFEKTKMLLEENIDLLEILVQELIRREKLTNNELRKILNNG